jgi:hypothetical protein
MDQGFMRFRPLIVFAALALVAPPLAAPLAQSESAAGDPVESLQGRLAKGGASLPYDGRSGRLLALLNALDIPVDSQVLVFSKTSFQSAWIGPETPRALYFNDDTAVGYVPGAPHLEITTTGVDGRIAFYTLDTTTAGDGRFQSERNVCLSCHIAVAPTGGLLVANVYPLPDGTPMFVTAERLFDVTDAATPFDARWGGWYVTGEHGSMSHRGNVRLDPDRPLDLDPAGGLNVTDLSSRVDLSPYPAKASDIVALMTLEHQLGAMNRIWRLQALRRPEDVDALAAYLVGVGEAPLTSPVRGVSTFTQTFPARGPRDGSGRSLRDFDLQGRLFRYPLSYTIYSRAFDGLDAELREQVYASLFAILSGADQAPRFAALSRERRREALQILAETKTGLPAYWSAAAGP